MSGFLIEQLDFVFLLYGMTFIFLAMMAGSMARRRSAGPEWRYLCAFGMIHGVNEWLDMLSLSVGSPVWLSILRGTVLTVSFLCLFEFGRRGVMWHWKWKAGFWIYTPVLFVVLYGVKCVPDDFLSLIRFLLAAPAGLLAALALWQCGIRRQDASMTAYRKVMAPLVMALYAISTGLIVPAAHFWPASQFNQEWFMACTGIPVQFIRFILASLLVVAIWYDYNQWRFRAFRGDFTQRIRFVRWVTLMAFTLVMVCGWILVDRADRQCREEHQRRLQTLSRSMNTAIQAGKVRELKAHPADLLSPAYLHVQSQCRNICEFDPAIRYVYLVELRERVLRFLMDVEPSRNAAQGERPTAVPGEVYSDAPPEIQQVFNTGKVLVSKPYRDSWGTFISCYSPVLDSDTGDIIAVLGVDTLGGQLLSDVAYARLLRLLLTGGAILLILIFAVLWQREIEETQLQQENGQRLQLQQSALLGVTNSPFVADGNIYMMARTVTQVTAEVMGVERAELWLRSKGDQAFRSENSYQADKGTHSSGQVSNVREGDPFFTFLESGRVAIISDCQTDERFASMKDEWGRAALVAPVRVSGRLTGWLVAIQTSRCRHWLTDEMRVISELADQVIHTLNNNDRQLAAASLQKAHDELELRVRERTEALFIKNKELSKEMAERHSMEQAQLRMQDRMQQAQKLESLGLMAGGIAHDFNNILMTVLGNVELARLETPAGSPLHEYLKDIDKASCRAAELARQMLLYSGRGHATIEGIELNDMVRDMAGILKVSLGKRVQMVFELEPGIPSIDGDLTQMRQVLMNFIINASDAIGENSGQITVRTGEIQCDQAMCASLWLKEENLPEGKYVFMDVLDTGCGMDAATVKRIFDPFFTTKFTGRGLGLAAVLGIIKGHHGAINVTSEKGKGSQFRVLLPVGQRGVRKECPKPTEEPSDWRGEGTILLADDEAPVRSLARRMLMRSGFSVLEACDGNEAIEIFKAQSHRISCVMLDMTMPDVNGKEAFEAIEKIDPSAKIVLCSGYMEEDMAAKFPDWHAAGFLQKPYKYEALISLLRRIMTH